MSIFSSLLSIILTLTDILLLFHDHINMVDSHCTHTHTHTILKTKVVSKHWVSEYSNTPYMGHYCSRTIYKCKWRVVSVSQSVCNQV